MPKIGPYRVPNHDIETIVELIDEASSRAQVSTGPLDEETFQEEVVQRKGGSYSRYRYSLQLYGFINRSHGADEVEITERFVDVADPVPRSARNEAIADAVGGVEILVELFQEGFEPGFSGNQLRVWLIQELNVPRDEAQEDTIEELRELYEPAYQYLKQSLEVDEADSEPEVQDEDEEEIEEETQPPGHGRGFNPPMGDGSDAGGVEMEVIQIGDKYVRLPKKNIGDEWRTLRATVDAYIRSLEGDDLDEGES